MISTRQATFVCVSLGEELTLYALDVEAAELTARGTAQAPAYVQAAWAHPVQPWLFVASSSGGPLSPNPVDDHFLTAFRIAPSGEMTQIGDSVRLDHRPVHICLDAEGAHAVVAYNEPANLTVHPIAPDGAVGAEILQPDLGLWKYPHQVRVSPDGGLVVVCARGNDATSTRPEDPGALHAFAYEDGRIWRRLAPVAPGDGYGFGPRNLDFHPVRPIAYVGLERQNELQVYGYGADGFEHAPRWRGTTLFGAASPAHQLAGMVRVHPDGRAVYVANRTMGTVEKGGEKVLAGGADDLAVFALDAAGDRLTPLQRIDTQGVMPRTFGFDPGGRILVVANHLPVTARDGAELRHIPQSLVLYRIADDGRLTFARKYEVESTAKWMFWVDVV
jgi:6-phosphogluconolactonase (cycloisomerase 2 family)